MCIEKEFCYKIKKYYSCECIFDDLLKIQFRGERCYEKILDSVVYSQNVSDKKLYIFRILTTCCIIPCDLFMKKFIWFGNSEKCVDSDNFDESFETIDKTNNFQRTFCNVCLKKYINKYKYTLPFVVFN